MTNLICKGTYKSGKEGGYKENIEYSGILNYGGIFELGSIISKLSWKIVSFD